MMNTGTINKGLTSRCDFESGVILNINKPAGWTSFDVVKKVRGLIRVKKVGHAGTLDPFATGVLLVCTGKATKSVESLMGLQKEYLAEIELGKLSDTYDCTGTIQEVEGARAVSLQEVQKACQSYVGSIEQVPPMFSAIKVNGQRLYELARKGIEVARKPRKVLINAVEVLEFSYPRLTIRVRCGRGTYIRSLAHDLGQTLGCGGYVTALTRTRVGPHTIADAWTIPELVRWQQSN